jgi:hypothetical protein
MLGAEQRDQVDLRGTEPLHRVAPLRVDAPLVADQADSPALDQAEAVLDQDVEPGQDAGCRSGRPGARQYPSQQPKHRKQPLHRRVLILLCVLAGACSPVPRPGPFPGPEPIDLMPEPEIASPLPVIAARFQVNQLLAALPLRDKIAQIVMPWVIGGYASFDDSSFSRVERWVDSLHVGGIIVSIGSPMDVAAKLNRLQRLSLAAAPHRFRPRGGHLVSLERWYALPHQYGRRRYRKRPRCL